MFWAYYNNATRRYFHRSCETDSPMERWLNRLAILGKIEEDDWHRENGKVFDIPECCREWFIYMACTMKVKNPLVATDKIYGEDRYEYVRCPYCRTEGE